MVTVVIWYTGGLLQLLSVRLSWGENSKGKHMIENSFCFLVKFIHLLPPYFIWRDERGGMGKKQDLLKRFEMTYNAFLDNGF